MQRVLAARADALIRQPYGIGREDWSDASTPDDVMQLRGARAMATPGPDGPHFGRRPNPSPHSRNA